MITIHQRHRQTDRQTDRQTTRDPNTALCTKVHRAVKIKITHSIAPINLQSSINVTGMSRCPNVCPIVLFRSTYFINITTVPNSTISSSNFNKILLSGVDINIQQAYKILLINSQLTGKNWRKRGEFQTHTAVRWLHALTHSNVITQSPIPLPPEVCLAFTHHGTDHVIQPLLG